MKVLIWVKKLQAVGGGLYIGGAVPQPVRPLQQRCGDPQPVPHLQPRRYQVVVE